MLRNLAERALEGLGVKDTAAFLQGEMLKQFGAIAASVGDAPGRRVDRRPRSARMSGVRCSVSVIGASVLAIFSATGSAGV